MCLERVSVPMEENLTIIGFKVAEEVVDEHGRPTGMFCSPIYPMYYSIGETVEEMHVGAIPYRAEVCNEWGELKYYERGYYPSGIHVFAHLGGALEFRYKMFQGERLSRIVILEVQLTKIQAIGPDESDFPCFVGREMKVLRRVSQEEIDKYIGKETV